MRRSVILNGFRWTFIILVACMIVLYGYQRLLLHKGIDDSVQRISPNSTIIGIIQTHTTESKEKVYRALYKTSEGKCFRATFERGSYSLILNKESSCN
ncbi:hypothetical protein [Bacillus sp. KH172YL63]|uniref:hypothetical protein n=1 Tax=Bacillus sp. KH172YL63 TaxID=2709784 RepID=UPI0013E49ACF|nr:hypothetical protein [Bacillus sp. KH172YL63]BCB04300.1 hypothetical protein KH172YL63_24330 [Bacillus sp. KH172YL63]